MEFYKNPNSQNFFTTIQMWSSVWKFFFLAHSSSRQFEFLGKKFAYACSTIIFNLSFAYKYLTKINVTDPKGTYFYFY